MVTTGNKETVLHRAWKFLRETGLELKKTSWPSKDELRKSTLLVLAFIIIFAVWIGGLDAILALISKRYGL